LLSSRTSTPSVGEWQGLLPGISIRTTPPSVAEWQQAPPLVLSTRTTPSPPFVPPNQTVFGTNTINNGFLAEYSEEEVAHPWLLLRRARQVSNNQKNQTLLQSPHC